MTLDSVLIQIFNGMVNGSFYALLSLGLAVIFGMLRVVNFAHGVFYMLGAFSAYLLLQQFEVSFWWALLVAPLGVGAFGMLLERLFIRRLYVLNPLYNFLLTFGIALVLQDAMRLRFGVQGKPYGTPTELAGSVDFGAFAFPNYRLFVIVFSLLACFAVWYLIERTRIGMVVRAATEKADLTRALGIDVDRWITPVFGFGVALAGLGGVLAAPMRQVSPLMGADLIIIIFAVVVIGGLGSILGSIITGFLVGVIVALVTGVMPQVLDAVTPGLSRAIPLTQLGDTLVFVLMAIILLVRPAGLLGAVESR
ncbi:MAG: branched-chain amino acid ABC transporter permease [Chloroflexota bacterium]